MPNHDWLISLEERIRNGTLLPAKYYADLDCDNMLDLRDGDEFEEMWMKHSTIINELWLASAMNKDTLKQLDKIRKTAFLLVSKATAQHEIASYVADDLELIVKAKLLGAKYEFIEVLFCVYENGQFPAPPFMINK
jgi:hypothetical protein